MKKAHSGHLCPHAIQQSWSFANSQHIVSACPSKYNLSAVNNLSIHSLTFPSFQSTWTTSRNHEKKLKCLGHKPSIAQRNSFFKCKTKLSGLFSMPKRLHREQCSQWTGDRKKGKSFLGIKRHCVEERHGVKELFGLRGDTHAHNYP